MTAKLSTAPTLVKLSSIRRDGGTQPRAALDDDTITEYADAMRNGDTFPPITVVYDGTFYWLVDGFHRVAAAKQVDGTIGKIASTVHQGTQRDAVLMSASVNATHGLRRTNEDKRRAVTVLLQDPEWSQWSDREIARRAKVSHTFVAKIRADIAPVTGNVASEECTYTTKHGTVATMNTRGIARRAEPFAVTADHRTAVLSLFEPGKPLHINVLQGRAGTIGLTADQITHVLREMRDEGALTLTVNSFALRENTPRTYTLADGTVVALDNGPSGLQKWRIRITPPGGPDCVAGAPAKREAFRRARRMFDRARQPVDQIDPATAEVTTDAEADVVREEIGGGLPTSLATARDMVSEALDAFRNHWPSLGMIAKQARLNRDLCARALDAMIEAGSVQKRQDGRRTLYHHAHMPVPEPQPEPDDTQSEALVDLGALDTTLRLAREQMNFAYWRLKRQTDWHALTSEQAHAAQISIKRTLTEIAPLKEQLTAALTALTELDDAAALDEPRRARDEKTA